MGRAFETLLLILFLAGPDRQLAFGHAAERDVVR